MPRIQLPRLSRIAVAAAASAAMIGSSFITPAHADTVPGVADTTALTSPVAPADAFKGDATPNSLEPESADPLPGFVSVAPTQVGDTVTPPPQAGGEHQADGQATTDTHIVKPETPPISGESYVVPEVQGISYQVDGKDVTGVQSVARGTSVNITAVAKPGFVLDKDVQSSWKYVNYFPANPVKPSRTENTITIPVSDGVSYQVDDATVTGTLTVPQDKPLTVKATTAEGYAFPKKATTSWDFTYTATAKPAEPTRSGGIITIPATTGVDYLVGGEVVRGTVSVAKGRAVTVTAQPGAGYRLAAGATQTWTMPPTTNDTPPTTGDDTEAGNKGAGGGGTGGSTGSGATTPNEGGAPYDKNTAAKPATQPFADVTASMQFANDIAWLKDRGITTGWPDGTFRPVTPVSRDAMIAYIYRMAGSPKYTPTAQTFSDVAPDDAYYTEIEWAAHEGITTGWPDGTFRPVTPVSRDAMAAFLYRLAGRPAVTLPATPSFSDVPADNMYYKEIAWMASTGISTGWPDQTFRPLTNTNRDAMAAFLHRAVESGVLTLA